MEDTSALIVPDDPETGTIERRKTLPPLEIDQKQMLSSVATNPSPPMKLESLPNAVIASEMNVVEPGSKQSTPRPPAAHSGPRPSGPAPRQHTARLEPLLAVAPATSTPVLDISDGEELDAVDVEQPLSARAAALNSKDYKAMAKRAAAAAKLDRLAGGNKSVF
ncbi:hypothetical protein BBJ28_00010496, partial [Nothophytophthora sp. Chile5]